MVETGVFESTDEKIIKAKKYATDSDEVQFGYILPGHGFKGKQHGLDSDDDIIEMYDVYRGRRNCNFMGEDQSCRASSKASFGII